GIHSNIRFSNLFRLPALRVHGWQAGISNFGFRISSELHVLLWALVFVLFSSAAVAQSGREYRRTAVHNGNQVRTVFGNWGVIGQPATGGPRGSWKNDNNGYLGDVSPFIGAEINWKGVTFHSVASVPVSRPTQLSDEDPATGKQWTLEPVSGYINPNQEKVAMSTDRNSWPPTWPDKLSDPSDPGWRGSWNGYFGKRINADQESYFVMDDNNDERFNVAKNNPMQLEFKPDALNLTRNGMALEMRVRGMQWSQFLAKDNIFWLYEITNKGTTTYDKVVFGMLVGTYVGVTGDDGRPGEYDDDWSFYDVRTNITYTGDYPRTNGRNPLWVGPVGMVGYAFLESPGNPYDGLDNDGDADSVSFALSAPYFNESRFDSTVIRPGAKIVLIGNDYTRQVYTVPSVDTVTVTTRGRAFLLRPGITKVAEGNILRDVQQNEFVNPNAYDGIDNDFDGIIDENYYLHYRQRKVTRTVPPVKLIDTVRAVRAIDYVNGFGSGSFSMIDERRNDGIDNNRDWSTEFDDVGRDGISGTGDFGEGDGRPTSGYDASGHDSGLPGEAHIDKTDVRESDQIGLTSFYYFTPAGQVRMGDDETLWQNLAPGFFDVPASIVNNRPERGEDGDFIYGSGYFPLLAGSTERFSLALVYGGGKGGSRDDDISDLLKNKQTVQKIYDANYQFPQPPDKPTLVAVPGDKQVTLYWDRKAEATIDPVLRTKDFEGYKIYRSTDPDFSDIFTVTDATGSPQGYRPLAQFDLKNDVSGYFRANTELFQSSSGFSYNLGTNTGLQHTYVDRDLDNGRRYFYALVAYDRGDEITGIFPSENTKFVSVLPTGEIVRDINTAVVEPNSKVAGYIDPANGVKLTAKSRYGTGDLFYNVVDGAKINGHTYRVEFLDNLTDSLDNNSNGRTDGADSTEWTRVTSSYSVRDMQAVSETFISQDTTVVTLTRKNILPSTVQVRNAQGTAVAASAYRLDASRGVIRGATAGSLPPGSYSVSYEYYPVFNSPYIAGGPGETKDADVFDGVMLGFSNDWIVTLIDTSSGWVGKNAYVYNFFPFFTDFNGTIIAGYRKPCDYEIRFSDRIVDTSYADPFFGTTAIPVNFRVYNLTDSTYIKFIFGDNVGNGKLSPTDEIFFLEERPDGKLGFTWDIFFVAKASEKPDTVYNLTSGDKLVLKVRKPFRKGDVYEFTTVKPKVEDAVATDELPRVRVVPNPYLTASSLEAPLPPGITSGRGQRRIDFIHVPSEAKISIFTSRGDHVVTLFHDANIEDGSVSWNLKSKENLDVAYGVYFYVLESPAGKKTGKIAIIK
ncbi:MAG TPA: hypothetical protein DEP53_09175, partial [Bacteroidetes bacterium]|nr:hypothetical protein [Bacteroidota bacterium]